MHQILLIVNKDKILNHDVVEDVGWYGKANCAGKLFDSIHFIP